MKSTFYSIIYVFCSFLICPNLMASDKIQKLDCRYYKSSDPIISKVFEVINSSDRIVTVHRNDEYSIGIYKLDNESRAPYKFSLDEVSDFLRNEKHKEILILSLSKGLLPEEDDKKEEYVKLLGDLFSLNGYKRVLITSSTGSGIEVLADR